MINAVMFADTSAGYFRGGRSKFPLPDQDSRRGDLASKGRQAFLVFSVAIIYVYCTASDERVDETIPERARVDAQRNTQSGYEDCSRSSRRSTAAELPGTYKLVRATTEKCKSSFMMLTLSYTIFWISMARRYADDEPFDSHPIHIFI